MKTFIPILMILFHFASASEYVIIANKSMPPLSKSQIRAIFLKKLTIVNEIKVVPVNLELREDLRKKFESEVLTMNFSKLKSYWTKQH